MIGKSTPAALAVAELIGASAPAGREEDSLLAGLRWRANGGRLVEAVREAAGDGEVSVVEGFLCAEIGRPASPAQAEFRSCVVRHGDGREERVEVGA